MGQSGRFFIASAAFLQRELCESGTLDQSRSSKPYFDPI